MPPFPEEQLDSPLGYFPAQLGQKLNAGKWTITRKLGWGPRSSTWLVVDHEDQHRALKILTAAATVDSNTKNESYFLLQAAKAVPSGIPELLETFEEKDDRGRKHLCLLFRLLGPSVEDLRQGNAYNGQNLPVHIVQKVIGDIVDRLANLATHNLIHGAVTPDNFLFFSVQQGKSVRKALAKFPVDKPIKVQGSDGIWYSTVKSQPIPNHYTWESKADDIAYTIFSLANFAHARQSTAQSLDTPKNIQPPEALTGANIDLKSDVWTLGCTTYLLLTGQPLFDDSYVASPISVAKETLGKLEILLRESGNVTEKDLAPTAKFLRTCLAVKPANRATALEILEGDWITSGCACGWCG
ncbi:kinase-like domain-containing protein [Mariannaea sp. PMI_226]|nr:kinase-like domain-containing protein [Mariannaea sp. PMI_226]